MTRSTNLEKRDQPRYLGDKPQRFGILPTSWFWNKRENWRQVSGMVSVVAGLGVMSTFFIPGLGPLSAALVASGAVVLCTGLIERYVRRKAKAQVPRLGPGPQA